MTKKCSKCNQELEDSAFAKNKNKLSSWCKNCNHMYYQKNKIRLLEQKRQHRLNNIEKYTLKDKTYYENNKEKVKERVHEYYKNNREKTLEHKKIYVAENREKIKISRKKFKDEHLEHVQEQYKKYYLEYYYNRNGKQVKALYRSKHADRCRAVLKKYRIKNKEKIRLVHRAYYYTKNGQDVQHKCHSRRKGFGYKPVNKWFKNSDFHHLHVTGLDGYGVYIPNEIHRSIHHKSTTGEGMKEINKVALIWLCEQSII